MTIQETIKAIVQQKNFMDNEELEKELGFLVWEVKRKIFNELQDKQKTLKIPKFQELLHELDGAIK
jgi:hypothetical protein